GVVVMFEDITHIEIFGVHSSDQKTINALLKDGWKILSIIQKNEDNLNSFGQIILGASDGAYEKNNLDLIWQKQKGEKSNEIDYDNLPF
ncbi:hypothetical protein, partial [Enterococcus durans]|uniref:hypothetical protein n=1 Tax=Enterococcus durans TaxID=53345 RepID=UPI001FBAFF5C